MITLTATLYSNMDNPTMVIPFLCFNAVALVCYMLYQTTPIENCNTYKVASIVDTVDFVRFGKCDSARIVRYAFA